MKSVEPIRTKKELNSIERFLGSRSLRNLLIFLMGTNCGLRISDILNLNVGDITKENYIDLTEKKTGKHKRFPINSKLKPLLNEFTRNRHTNEPLFLSRCGNRMERTQCYRMIYHACKQAGIKYIVGTHTLRKTFGYHHYKKYRDIAILQKMFNHSSPYITLRYIGIDQDAIDKSYSHFVL